MARHYKLVKPTVNYHLKYTHNQWRRSVSNIGVQIRLLSSPLFSPLSFPSLNFLKPFPSTPSLPISPSSILPALPFPPLGARGPEVLPGKFWNSTLFENALKLTYGKDNWFIVEGFVMRNLEIWHT
jgi:hypothetical protein